MAVDTFRPGLKRRLGFGFLTLHGVGVVSVAAGSVLEVVPGC